MRTHTGRIGVIEQERVLNLIESMRDSNEQKQNRQ